MTVLPCLTADQGHLEKRGRFKPGFMLLQFHGQFLFEGGHLFRQIVNSLTHKCSTVRTWITLAAGEGPSVEHCWNALQIQSNKPIEEMDIVFVPEVV
jgi:hypothetical protein